jgi:UDP-N-acetylglucosamine--N-acetylmuramyl-(pentapeptide) pyrophosphoryl-undecaprenol N-acetylglucosamine transferase
MKWILTGGHLTPAISLLQYLKSTGHQAVFIGRDHTGDKLRAKNHEELEVTGLGYPFVPFKTSKYNRYHPWRSLISLPLLVTAYQHALRVLESHRPDALITFGGYVSVPVALAALRLKIPIVIHEQTAVAGLANEFIGRFADVIALSYPMSRRYFPAPKVHVTGNLLRQEIYDHQTVTPPWLAPPIRTPLIYITGGSQGSLAINQAVSPLYQELAKDYLVIHQTGQNSLAGSYETMQFSWKKLPKEIQPKVIIKPHLSARETAWIFQNAHCVISRAGANTLSELIACNVPSILVPLEKTHHDEQGVHARLIRDAHGGYTLAQKHLSPKSLKAVIAEVSSAYPSLITGMRSLRQYINPYANRDLMALVQKSLKHN